MRLPLSVTRKATRKQQWNAKSNRVQKSQKLQSVKKTQHNDDQSNNNDEELSE